MKNTELKGLLTLMAGIVAWFILMVLMVGCGMDQRVKGGTDNKVSADGKVDVNIVLKIDLTTCNEFGTAAKLDCIEAITGAFESLGDLSKILVCDPNDQAKCDLLEKILGDVK